MTASALGSAGRSVECTRTAASSRACAFGRDMHGGSHTRRGRRRCVCFWARYTRLNAHRGSAKPTNVHSTECAPASRVHRSPAAPAFRLRPPWPGSTEDPHPRSPGRVWARQRSAGIPGAAGRGAPVGERRSGIVSSRIREIARGSRPAHDPEPNDVRDIEGVRHNRVHVLVRDDRRRIALNLHGWLHGPDVSALRIEDGEAPRLPARAASLDPEEALGIDVEGFEGRLDLRHFPFTFHTGARANRCDSVLDHVQGRVPHLR